MSAGTKSSGLMVRKSHIASGQSWTGVEIDRHILNSVQLLFGDRHIWGQDQKESSRKLTLGNGRDLASACRQYLGSRVAVS